MKGPAAIVERKTRGWDRSTLELALHPPDETMVSAVVQSLSERNATHLRRRGNTPIGAFGVHDDCGLVYFNK